MFIGQMKLPGRPTFASGVDTSVLPTADRLSRQWAEMQDLYGATRDAQLYVENSNAEDEAFAHAYEERNRRIHEATGVQLDNPFRDVVAEGDLLPGRKPGAKRDSAVAAWNARVAELAAQYPDKASVIAANRTIEQDVRQLVGATEQRLDRPRVDLNWAQRLGASLAGGLSGSFRDPVQLWSFMLGGVETGAATALSRMGATMLQEAVINGGVEAAVQTRAQKWRAENGLEHGAGPALRQVGLAALFGGTVGGIIAGAREAAGALGITGKAEREAIERVAGGQPKPGDFETAAKALKIDVSPMERQVADLAREQVDLNRAAFGERPEGVTAAEADMLEQQAIASVEDADGALPPVGVPAKPARDPATDTVVSEDAPAPAGNRVMVRGKPVTFRQFDPSRLETDARAYQYKDGGDAEGVTDRLGGVTQWDPTASGKIFAHERADGRTYIADGHQRLGLAKRLQEEGRQDVRLDGYLYREADGWTVEDVRALAAKKNMQEGSGSAMDAARILRDKPMLMDRSLPVTGPMLKKASALARLGEDAWRLVTNGIAEEHHGVAVGSLISNPSRQAAVLDQVARAAPETERMTELLVREIEAAGFRHETQSDMFGELAVTRSLMAERVKVLDEALKTLSRDKRLFAALTQNADLIEAAGNVLDTAGNVNRAATAQNVAGLIDRLARSRGVVSDALTAAAERFADGSTARKEAKAFIDEVRSVLDRDGIRALLEERPAPVLKPAAAVEPATAEASEIAELARIEAGDGEPEAKTLWDVMPNGVDAEGQPRFTDLSAELEQADLLDNAADLVASCKD